MRATLTLNNSFQIELPSGGSFLCVNITFSAGKNTVEVLYMTEKPDLKKLLCLI